MLLSFFDGKLFDILLLEAVKDQLVEGSLEGFVLNETLWDAICKVLLDLLTFEGVVF